MLGQAIELDPKSDEDTLKQEMQELNKKLEEDKKYEKAGLMIGALTLITRFLTKK